jgi:hypothetical protein
VFWWKEDCEATDAPVFMPTPSPTQLRGSVDHPSPSIFGGGSSSIGQSGGYNSIGNGAGNSNSGANGGSDSIAQQGSSNEHESMSFMPVADTYIRIDRPEKNYGKKKQLIVGTDGETVTLIKFDIKRVKKKLHCVDKATLSLYSLNDEKNGGVINTYDPNIFSRDELWDETSITWSNAPKERPYTYYNEIGRVKQNQWVEVDVTKELGRDRFVTFRLVGGKWNKYASKESRHPPILTIDLC